MYLLGTLYMYINLKIWVSASVKYLVCSGCHTRQPLPLSFFSSEVENLAHLIEQPPLCITATMSMPIGDYYGQAPVYFILDIVHAHVHAGIHPTTISDSFQAAAAQAIQVLTDMSTPVTLADRESLLKSATTSLSSKVCLQQHDIHDSSVIFMW